MVVFIGQSKGNFACRLTVICHCSLLSVKKLDVGKASFHGSVIIDYVCLMLLMHCF